VAETTLAYERDIKLTLYARAGIPEVWIIDLAAPMLHIHRAPAGEVYTDVAEIAAPAPVPLAALSEITVDLSGLFASSQ
jgi:Uma2 family endonuclease